MTLTDKLKLFQSIAHIEVKLRQISAPLYSERGLMSLKGGGQERIIIIGKQFFSSYIITMRDSGQNWYAVYLSGFWL